MATLLRRRDLALPLLAAPLLAQTAPAPTPIPATAEAELQAARESTKQSREKLAALPVPMATEPAFAFRVY